MKDQTKCHDTAERLARLKPPENAAEDLNKGGGSRRESAPAIPSGSQLAFIIEKGDVGAPNARTVEAMRKAEWPPQGQTTERESGLSGLREECCASMT